jgi:hypothetical protein
VTVADPTVPGALLGVTAPLEGVALNESTADNPLLSISCFFVAGEGVTPAVLPDRLPKAVLVLTAIPPILLLLAASFFK